MDGNKKCSKSHSHYIVRLLDSYKGLLEVGGAKYKIMKTPTCWIQLSIFFLSWTELDNCFLYEYQS